MNRLVYLYELDSVRNTETEIELGQQALFREIVLNGNIVVLSFNQLTDSDAFHNLLMEDATYECVMNLFRNGAIKISRFGSYRTPSQYIQVAIDKCLKKDDDTFLFSGLPVKSSEKDLLQLMKDALQFSDVAKLEEYLDERKAEYADEKSEGDQKECEEIEKDWMRLDFLIRYVRMLLTLSGEGLACNPRKENTGRSFTYYMERMLSMDYGAMLKFAGIEDAPFLEMVQQGTSFLKEISNDFTQKNVEGIQNRSKWIDEIEKIGEKDISGWKHRKNIIDKYSMAIAIVEICYNYTIEDSIHNVSKRYDVSKEYSFEKDYVSNLYQYWNQIRRSIHIPTTDDDAGKRFIKVDIPWTTAVRTVVNNKDKTTEVEAAKNSGKEKSSEQLLYYTDFQKDARKWNFKIAWNLFKQFFYTIIYIVLFCIVQWIMGKLEGLVSSTNILQGFWYDVIVSMILFGILGSVVSEVTGLPDILESMKNIGRGVKDTLYIIFTPIRRSKNK